MSKENCSCTDCACSGPNEGENLRDKAEEQLLDVAIPGTHSVVASGSIEDVPEDTTCPKCKNLLEKVLVTESYVIGTPCQCKFHAEDIDALQDSSLRSKLRNLLD